MATILLGAGEVGLFGYGSLLSLSSMERTLGRRYERERIVCRLPGWRRVWDSIYPNRRYWYAGEGGERVAPENILYLNVRRVGTGVLNGVVYVVPEESIAGFDRREETYERIDVAGELLDLRVEGGAVYMYVGQAPHLLSGGAGPASLAAIRRAYVDIVEGGVDELGAEFREGYEASTDVVPWGNVVDYVLD